MLSTEHNHSDSNTIPSCTLGLSQVDTMHQRRHDDTCFLNTSPVDFIQWINQVIKNIIVCSMNISPVDFVYSSNNHVNADCKTVNGTVGLHVDLAICLD